MMTPTQLGHARIAGNVERLLSDALDVFDPGRIALHDIGVNLSSPVKRWTGLAGGGLCTAARCRRRRRRLRPGPEFANRLYVAVEVVSSTDDAWLTAAGMPWSEAKTRLYQAHSSCEAVVVVEQRRWEMRLSLRSGARWSGTVLTRPDFIFRAAASPARSPTSTRARPCGAPTRSPRIGPRSPRRQEHPLRLDSREWHDQAGCVLALMGRLRASLSPLARRSGSRC